MTGLALACLLGYSFGPIKMRRVSSGSALFANPPILYPAAYNAFQRAPIEVDGSFVSSILRAVKVISANAAPLFLTMEGTPMGSGIFHPALVKVCHKLTAKRYISGPPSWYSIIALPGGAFFNIGRMMFPTIPRGSCLFLSSANCSSACVCLSLASAVSLCSKANSEFLMSSTRFWIGPAIQPP